MHDSKFHASNHLVSWLSTSTTCGLFAHLAIEYMKLLYIFKKLISYIYIYIEERERGDIYVNRQIYEPNKN